MAIFGGSRSPAPFASAAMFTIVLGVLAFSVVVVIGQQLLFIAWGLITHALICITGRSHHALGHTLSATQYCAGTFIVSAIPLCGFYLSLISLVWMAVAMVSALAALHKISRWRTAFAVLAPLVVIVPKAAIDEVIARVDEKNSGENLFRKAVREGMAPSEAFAKYGVL